MVNVERRMPGANELLDRERSSGVAGKSLRRITFWCAVMGLLLSGTNLGKLAFAQADSPAAKLKKFEKTEVHMGSPFTIVFYCAEEKVANEAFSRAFDRIAKLDKTLSDYDLESETSRLCASAPHAAPVSVSKDLLEVLSISAAISKQSDGAFDVTVGPLTKLWRRARRQKELPSKEQFADAMSLVGTRNVVLDSKASTVQINKAGVRLDFGGIGQGHAADEVIKILSEMGMKQCLVNASGDVVALDPPPGELGWKVALIGLQPKTDPPKQFVWLKNAAITTSGDAFQYVEIDGKRYSHIVDPATGVGIGRRISATVYASTCTRADAWATALCLLPKENGIELLQKAVPEAEALIVEMDDGAIVEKVTPKFPRRHAIEAPSM